MLTLGIVTIVAATLAEALIIAKQIDLGEQSCLKQKKIQQESYLNHSSVAYKYKEISRYIARCSGFSLSHFLIYIIEKQVLTSFHLPNIS